MSCLPGLARDCHFRFPRIWAVLHRRFPGEHSSFLKSVASAGSATPAWLVMYSYLAQGSANVTSVWLSACRVGFSSFLALAS